MTRFYGEIEGKAKTIASRLGTPNTGLWAHIRGWNVGAEIVCEVNEDGKDVIKVYKTGGSNNISSRELLAVITEDKNSD